MFASIALALLLFAALEQPSPEIANGILLTECTYGNESGSNIRPLRSLMIRADGHATGTTAPFATSSELHTVAAGIGAERFRELANRFDRSTLYPPAAPEPSPSGLEGFTFTTDTRSLVIGGRRGDLWYFWEPASHAVGVDHHDLIEAVDAVVGNKALTWRPAPLQANAFNVCTGKTIGAP